MTSSASSMDKIIQGVQHFHDHIFKEKQALFKTLAKEQKPKILFITCSDSRVTPTLITQTDPGDLFVIQNAGNIIPPHGALRGGIGASIEYAVAILNVEHIIVCGHSNCGAMGALLDSHCPEKLPETIKRWLDFAETTKAIVDSDDQERNEDQTVDAYVHQNVSVQLNHLKTIPSIASKMVQKKLQLHGWVFGIETGELTVYDAKKDQFIPFKAHYSR